MTIVPNFKNDKELAAFLNDISSNDPDSSATAAVTNDGTEEENNVFEEEQQEQQEQQSEEKYEKIYSVADALRLHSGPVKVQGMITSLSQVFKMYIKIVYRCGNCGTINERLRKNQDIPVFSLAGLAPSKCINCGEKTSLMFDLSNSELINAVIVDFKTLVVLAKLKGYMYFCSMTTLVI